MSKVFFEELWRTKQYHENRSDQEQTTMNFNVSIEIRMNQIPTFGLLCQVHMVTYQHHTYCKQLFSVRLSEQYDCPN